MATPVKLVHKDTGFEKTGFIGYSWTTLLFGPFPLLFRGEYLIFLVYFAVAVVVGLVPVIGWLMVLVGGLVWSFQVNAFHMRKLLGQGYMLADTDETNKKVVTAVQMSPTAIGAEPASRDLTSDAYKIFLVKKYKIEKNDSLGKMVVGERLFDTIDEALVYADSLMPPAAGGTRPVSRDLTDDAYRIFLVKKHKIEKNDALGKIVAGERLFDTIDEALAYAHSLEKDTGPVPVVAPEQESWRQMHTIVRTIPIRGGKVFALSGGLFAVPNSNTVFGTMDEAVKFAMARGSV